MVVVQKKKGESTDRLLKRFVKISKDENINFEVSKKMFFKKPSEMKKEKQKEKAKRKAQQRRFAS